jgi:signal transduction histidine kinase
MTPRSYLSSITRDEGGVVISIADTGPGISAEAVERVFNPLFTTKRRDGYGLVDLPFDRRGA